MEKVTHSHLPSANILDTAVSILLYCTEESTAKSVHAKRKMRPISSEKVKCLSFCIDLNRHVNILGSRNGFAREIICVYRPGSSRKTDYLWACVDSTHYFFPTQTNPFLPLESELVTTFVEATNKEVLPGIASMIIIEIQSAPIQINDLIIVQ